MDEFTYEPDDAIGTAPICVRVDEDFVKRAELTMRKAAALDKLESQETVVIEKDGDGYSVEFFEHDADREIDCRTGQGNAPSLLEAIEAAMEEK